MWNVNGNNKLKYFYATSSKSVFELESSFMEKF